MIEENVARLRARRQNIDRYNRLLRTNLTALERDFIKCRIAEEQSEGSLNRDPRDERLRQIS